MNFAFLFRDGDRKNSNCLLHKQFKHQQKGEDVGDGKVVMAAMEGEHHPNAIAGIQAYFYFQFRLLTSKDVVHQLGTFSFGCTNAKHLQTKKHTNFANPILLVENNILALCLVFLKLMMIK